ncbi:MAG: energy transducer TonB [Alcanivoracaceae bacterium]|jgi:protein TonB|nr:energy transducer TonB [Alcanivoracaceae bacterium]
MNKHIVAGIFALLLPWLIFTVVISLNGSGVDLEEIRNSAMQFDVQKKSSVSKPPPPKKPEPPQRQQREPLPTLSASDVDSSLGMLGLDFGMPSMSQTGFSELGGDDLLGSGADTAMDKDSVDIPPRAVRRAPIVYPELARQQGISGYVTMSVLIDEEGNVEDVRILESNPPEIFDLKAESTVRMWKFSPASYDGKAVKVWATQQIAFKLE